MNQLNIVTITRGKDDHVEVIGRLDTGTFSCLTLERPWKNNTRNISCIPKGAYQCEWKYMPNMRILTYQILEVPGRDGIFFHYGNFVTDTDGCILLGRTISDLNGDGKQDIANSRNAWSSFIMDRKKLPFTLIVQ